MESDQPISRVPPRPGAGSNPDVPISARPVRPRQEPKDEPTRTGQVGEESSQAAPQIVGPPPAAAKIAPRAPTKPSTKAAKLPALPMGPPPAETGSPMDRVPTEAISNPSEGVATTNEVSPIGVTPPPDGPKVVVVGQVIDPPTPDAESDEALPAATASRARRVRSGRQHSKQSALAASIIGALFLLFLVGLLLFVMTRSPVQDGGSDSAVAYESATRDGVADANDRTAARVRKPSDARKAGRKPPASLTRNGDQDEPHSQTSGGLLASTENTDNIVGGANSHVGGANSPVGGANSHVGGANSHVDDFNFPLPGGATRQPSDLPDSADDNSQSADPGNEKDAPVVEGDPPSSKPPLDVAPEKYLADKGLSRDGNTWVVAGEEDVRKQQAEVKKVIGRLKDVQKAANAIPYAALPQLQARLQALADEMKFLSNQSTKNDQDKFRLRQLFMESKTLERQIEVIKDQWPKAQQELEARRDEVINQVRKSKSVVDSFQETYDELASDEKVVAAVEQLGGHLGPSSKFRQALTQFQRLEEQYAGEDKE